jgi:ABC-type uncharacterized transport system auxiliary subunit
MKNYKFIVFAFIIITLAGCSVYESIERSYYIFDYNDRDERAELFMDTPLPYSVFIQNAQIAHTYSRKQIVKRHYGPQIRYLDYHLWGIRLQDAIQDLVSTRITRYNIFENVNRNLINDVPDYQISLEINNLEIYETAYLSEAHLNMVFYIQKMNEADKNIPNLDISYRIDRTARINHGDVETFVQLINEMILQETDNFTARFLNTLTGFIDPARTELSSLQRYEEIDYSAKVIGDSTTVDNRGIGLLYLPNLSGEENEPFYFTYDESGNEVGSARMGEELPLPEGTYEVRYGTLREAGMMTQEVNVKPRWRYSVEPDWGCLIVDVMDEQRNYVKTGFTLFDNETGFDFGIDYPADINLGEKPNIRVLKPGTYKVTLNNASFNTYRDFTTIEVLENSSQRLTLIVEEDEDTGLYSLIGAGVLNETDSQLRDSNWKLGSAVHMNVNLNTDNSEKVNETQLSINMNAQIDNTAFYQMGRLRYTLKNLIEIGTNKDVDYSQFRVDLDDFDLKNTLIFNLFSAFGFYGRFDLNTHFFPARAYDLNYIKVSAEGDTISSGSNVHSVETAPPLLPVSLKEGFGINYQFLDTDRADMNLRAGLGFRQELRNDVYSYSSDWTDNAVDPAITYRVYTEDESSYYEGIEASLVGDLRILRNLNYSLSADFLFPFDSEKNYTMEFENIFNFKLLRYISLDYRLKFYSRDAYANDDKIITQQTLFLRFTYLLR